MDGTKFTPVVIGKSQNPKCFKNINKQHLPVHYYNSRNAWMTRDIFCDWFVNHSAPDIIIQIMPKAFILGWIYALSSLLGFVEGR